MLTIYHNGRCSKSRETLELIRGSGKEATIVEYLTHPPSPAELDRLCEMLGMEPEAIVRKKEPVFAELGLSKKPPKDRAAWLALLAKHPILIERPIVTDGKRAVLGRPPENVKALL